MVSVLAWVIFHAPQAHAKTDTRFLLYQKKPVSENCNCFQSTISKITVILSLSFQKSDQFFCSLQTWHTVPHIHSWENRVNYKKNLEYFRFEFLILNLIAQLKNFLLGGIFFVIFSFSFSCDFANKFL